MDYLSLTQRYDDLSDEIWKLLQGRRRADLRRLAELRLERAWVELHLRDLWGPWSPRGHVWQCGMREDVRAAQAIADELAAQVGDRQLPQRLFMPYPELAGAASA